MKTLGEVIDEYGEAFKDLFEAQVQHFIDTLLFSVGIIHFDVVRFDEYLHRRAGYREEKHGSMKQFIQEKYGDKGMSLIKSLMDL
jgi:cyanate lyase